MNTKRKQRETDLFNVVSTAFLVLLLIFAVTGLSNIRGEIENNLALEQISDLETQNNFFLYEVNYVFSEMDIFANFFYFSPPTQAQMTTYRESRLRYATDVGLISLEGDSVFGGLDNLESIDSIKQATKGEIGFSYVDDYFGKSGVMFAVPVYNQFKLQYVLYEMKTLEQMHWINYSIAEAESSFDENISNSEDVAFLIDSEENFIFSPQSNDKEILDIIEKEIDLHDLNERISLHYANKYAPVYTETVRIGNFNYTILASYILGMTSVRIIPPTNDGQNIFVLINQFLSVLIVFFAAYMMILYTKKKHETEFQEKMFNIAYVDDLTGICNWEWLQEQMRKNQDAIRDKTLIIINIKEFKTVNALYGRDYGDAVLKEIADRLKEQTWADAVARGSSDTFLMLVERSSFAQLHAKLTEMFNSIRKIDKDANSVYFRCGVVDILSPLSEVNCYQLFDQLADAMNEAFIPKKTEIIFYSESMRAEEAKNQRLREEFTFAMKAGEFEVFLQPKFEIKTGNLAGAEALIRWKYKKEAYISPAEFVPLFEQDGTVKEIDRFVFRKVCAQFSLWADLQLPLFPISVNLSRVQMDNENLVSELSSITDAYNVKKKYVQIEITESGYFQDMDQLIHVLNDLKEAGFELAMDDFGTGYSSFSLLKDMPLEVLKIDKSFVDKLDDQKGLHIIKGIITMAKHLGIKCLAEGVETEEQHNILRDFDCDYIQGYYFAKPMPISQYEELLRRADEGE
ncbi:MAG: GGDEF domain-containing phosphodiesterase [Eubacteriales bacterium]